MTPKTGAILDNIKEGSELYVNWISLKLRILALLLLIFLLKVLFYFLIYKHSKYAQRIEVMVLKSHLRRLPVSSPVYEELKSHHSILTMGKKLSRMKKISTLISPCERGTQSKVLARDWRCRQ